MVFKGINKNGTHTDRECWVWGEQHPKFTFVTITNFWYIVIWSITNFNYRFEYVMYMNVKNIIIYVVQYFMNSATASSLSKQLCGLNCMFILQQKKYFGNDCRAERKKHFSMDIYPQGL